MAARARIGKTTIVDIAAASGVSVTTVSRILNEKPDVAPETRERVLRVMDEIGFAPQSAWRQIRSGRSGAIAVHVPHEFNPPNLRVVMAAALAVEDAGYSINLITRSLTDSDLLGIFRSREVDGIILLEVLADDRRPELLRDHGFPFVMVGHRFDNEGLSFVDVDIDQGIREAVDHLVALGHTAIALLTYNLVIGGKQYGYTTWVLQAYEAACRRHGLTPLTCFAGVSVDHMSAAAQSMLESHPEVTAFVAPQEHSAMGVLHAAHSLRLRIPEDLSLVAMLGGMSGELANPLLTTLTFPADELGGAAARLLMDKLCDPDAFGQTFFPPSFTVQGSTAHPRKI